MPLGVEEFLQYVHPMDKDSSFRPGVPFREYSTKSHLVTNNEIQELLGNDKSFLYGRNPNEKAVPIYGVVNLCPSTRAPAMPAVPTTPPTTTRGVYIPVSIDPLEERNDTIRRSSRLFPLFQRVKRESPTVPQYNQLNEYEELVMEATQKPSVQQDSEPEPENGVPVNNFIANLADNVKFSGGTDPDDNLEENSIGQAPEKEEGSGKGKLPGFHVTYWMFYPYSQGKTMCTVSLGPLGRIPFPAVYGYCLGNRKDIGSHVGDWEHMPCLRCTQNLDGGGPLTLISGLYTFNLTLIKVFFCFSTFCLASSISNAGCGHTWEFSQQHGNTICNTPSHLRSRYR